MKKYNYEDAVLKEIPEPEKDCTLIPVDISDKTIEQRKQKIIEKMNQRKIDVLLIYADLEHGNNFEYLVGFLPRFEEALLVFHKDQKAYLVMGNENLNKVSKARLQCKAIHAPYFSLPNQTSVYKGYKQDKIEMRGDRAEMSDFPLYLNTVAGGLDRRDQTIGGFSFVVKIYAVPAVEIIG